MSAGIVGEDIDPRDVLPTVCPSWCSSGPNGHYEAFHQIGDPDPTDASEHMGADQGHRLVTMIQPHTGETLREGGHSWCMDIRAAGGHYYTNTGYPFIHFEASDKQHKGLTMKLTSSEARVLARQLTHLADQIDLEP